jgi:hypothetical protein
MILSFEIPTNYLNSLGKFNDFDFCLAHLTLSSSTYLDYYKASKKYKIMDNSAFELGEPMPFKDVVKAAELVNADEIVAPDSFKNSSKTVSNTQSFLDYLNSNKITKYKIMGVVQGENFPAWANCISYMENSPNIDIIGLSYVGCTSFDPDPMTARLKAVRWIVDFMKIRKPVHLLGIGANPIEVSLHGPNPMIRSCDTSIPIVQGLAGDTFDSKIGMVSSKLPRPANYFDLSINASQMDSIIHNLNQLKAWADFSHV